MSLTITIEVATPDVSRVLNAMSGNYNRQPLVLNPDFDPGRPDNPGSNPRMIDNPETEEDFMNRILRQFLSENVYSHEVREANRAAQAGVNRDVGIS